ncbi:MAG: hypothetical protein ACRC0L_13120, partial [Angustibacter sp.]
MTTTLQDHRPAGQQDGRLAIDSADQSPSWGPRVRAARAVVVDDGRRVGLTSLEPQGCYGRVRAWSSRQGWLHRVRVAVDQNPGLLRSPSVRDVVSVDMFMRVLTAYVSYADDATGRGIRVSNTTIAQVVGCQPKTVTRVMRLCERRLGIIITIAHARPLTLAERMIVRGRREAPGVRCTQRGLPTLRAAHTPTWMAAMTNGV